MIETPFRVLPPPLLFGLLVYAAVCALWLQPAIEHRLTERVLVPQCEALLREADEALLNGRAQERTSKQRQVDSYLEAMRRAFGDNPLIGIIADQATIAAEAALPDVAPSKRGKSSSLCGCGSYTALDSIRLWMLAHVMTGRLYHPAPLESLPLDAARNASSGQCALNLE